MTTLDDHVAALRALGEDADPAEAAGASATRGRVRRTLESGRGVQRHAGLFAALAVMLVASASWAVATGRIQQLWRAPEHSVEQTAPAVTAPPAPPSVIPRPAPAPVDVVAPVPPAALAAPAPPAAVAPAARVHPHVATSIAVPVAAPIAAPPDDVPAVAPGAALYRRAHDLYFHGADYALALDAWDRYLAAAPDGQFAVEARYNRALCLVRLARLDEARDALGPFARGEVAPAGYRQHEAAALIDKIDRRAHEPLNGSR